MEQRTGRTLPTPTDLSDITAHLVADHGWPPYTPINGEHARAHHFAHGGGGRPDLADPQLTHTHLAPPPIRPGAGTGSRAKVIGGVLATFIAVAVLGYGLVVAIQGHASATTDQAGGSTTSSTFAKVPNLVDAPVSAALNRYVESRDPNSLSINVSGYSFSTVETDLTAFLDYLGFNSSAVIARMGQTRALDGTQSDAGRYATVHWNYHPDHGMSMVFERPVAASN
jgi:hypothetical protein